MGGGGGSKNHSNFVQMFLSEAVGVIIKPNAPLLCFPPPPPHHHNLLLNTINIQSGQILFLDEYFKSLKKNWKITTKLK